MVWREPPLARHGLPLDNVNENWNFNEFVHAAVILVTFHKLAAISETLNLNVRGIKEICQNENLNTSDSSESKCKYCLKIANLSIMAALTKEHEKSKNIFNNLDILNQEEDKDEMKRKTSTNDPKLDRAYDYLEEIRTM